MVAASCSAAATEEIAETAAGEPAILALGDSMFEWNVSTGESIPEVIGDVLDRPVLNAAVGGAHFSDATPVDGGEASDIRAQYVRGDWAWVVLEGGANDLHDDCGCGACAKVLDDLVSADGRTGEIPDFVRTLAADGTRVMVVGYYAVPSDAEFGFDRCVDEVAEQGRRLQAMAAAFEGVWFVSAADVVTADERGAYAQDRVHPSPVGARLIGEHVAATIQHAERNPTTGGES